ncbi:AAA family ATPase [Malikia sp.]|uniref:bifunctional aminoglycoside phosphotransferase/ATP-binding protein n=1 Tax=Malikia sp. TaxID=2070706 RepID=UPI00260CF04E|nr:AAA family ATPase [Malikia sp.]MDD2729767.1 AAA family ATPase [Malikia sp.]
MDLSPCLPGAVRIDTHISTVWLAGDYAYKLKKPVSLPFLDFSTLERRRFFLEEELRLNRRTAPELYLDLLPVTGGAAAPVLGGVGEPIEWVLRMRRFPAGASLSELAASGQLQASHIDALAAHVADFHQSLPALPAESAPAKEVVEWTRESLDEAESNPLRPPAIDLARVLALRERLLARLEAQAAWRAARLRDGFLREGHGDLHLGNLVLWRGGVIAFDAIEFEPALRCIDLMNDVAFAFMDLLACGRVELAWRFVNGYVERSGDFDGLVGLRAFAAYRALVRAKVALLSGQPEGFLRYWPLAEALAADPAPPHLLLVMGLSGAGKSTLAALLAEQSGAIRLRSDVERKRLFGLAATDRPAPGRALYGAEATRLTYARLSALAEGLLVAGHSVVVDAALLRQAERAALRALARRLGTPFLLVECVASQQRMEQRLVARAAAGTDASDAGIEVQHRQREWAEPVPADWVPEHRLVANDGSLADLQAAVVALLAEARR